MIWKIEFDPAAEKELAKLDAQQIKRLIISLLKQTPEAQFFNNMILKTHREEETDPIYPNETQIDDIDRAYRATVYNIEVEDFHTYYVGRAGIFTHS